MRYNTYNTLMTIGMVSLFVAILGTIGLFFRYAYLKDAEHREYRKACEERCAPFSYRTYYGCECRDKNNNWVPQQDF